MQRDKSVYKNISVDIISKINDGTYPVGKPLPSERLLTESYNVERTTVRRALELLCEDGYIEKRAGVGSIVVSVVENKVEKPQESKSVAKPVAKSVAKSEKSLKAESKPTENGGQVLLIYPQVYSHSQRESSCLISKTVAELGKYLAGKGTKLITVTSSDKQSIEKAVGGKRVYGAIICEILDSCAKLYLNDNNIPSIILFGNADGYRSVNPDNDGAMHKLVGRLCENGHKSIAFIGSDEVFSGERQRRLAFAGALESNGLVPSQELICTGGHNEKSGHDRFCELYRRSGRKFTAVCAVSYEAAVGAVKAANEFGLKVPDDISVTGFGSVTEKCSITSAYVDTKSLAQEAYLALLCEVTSKTSIGVSTITDISITGNTVSRATITSEPQRKSMSDFLL